MGLPVVGAVITAAIVSGAARVAVAAVGFGIVTYAGVDILLDQAMDAIKANMGAAGIAAQMAGLMKIDKCISIIVGAFTIRLSLIPLKRLMLI